MRLRRLLLVLVLLAGAAATALARRGALPAERLQLQTEAGAQLDFGVDAPAAAPVVAAARALLGAARS